MTLKRKAKQRGHYLLLLCLLIFIFGFTGDVLGEDAESRKGNDVSIVGGTFHVIGEVVSFPFRVIGKAFDFIF